MAEKIKIAICSTVHSHDDPRVFHRQANTLAECYHVTLFICAPFAKKEIKNNFVIIGLPVWKKKSDRIKNIILLVRHLLKIDAQLYIFHDPELLILFPFVKWIKRGKIIYDIHENYREFIQGKLWIPPGFRKVLSLIYSTIERVGIYFSDMIWFPVEDVVRHLQNGIGTKKLLVRNLPEINKFKELNLQNCNSNNQIVYIGSMDSDRGIGELIQTFSIFLTDYPQYTLVLAGPFYTEKYEEEIKKLIQSLNLSTKVQLLNRVPYERIPNILSESKVGMLTLPPMPNYIHSLPNKLFEYMAMGLPIIASDFKNFQDIIEPAKCGVCVNPNDIREVVKAMKLLVEDEERRRKMGLNGRKMVELEYNWEREGAKMVDAIKELGIR